MISEEMQAVVLDLLQKWRSGRKRRQRGKYRRYTQRWIAEITGISRGTVRTIDKRGRVRPVRKKDVTSSLEDVTSLSTIGVPPKTVCCERCGMMALASEPCEECRLRRLHKQIQPVGHPPSDITLELRPAEQARYEEIYPNKVREALVSATDPDPRG